MARTRIVIIAATLLVSAACGGGGGGGGDGGGGGGGASSLATEVIVTQADERVPHGLAEGRYRVRWTRSDACEGIHLVVTPAAGGEPIYDFRPVAPILFINDVAAGEYFVEQMEPSCTEWEITMTRS